MRTARRRTFCTVAQGCCRVPLRIAAARDLGVRLPAAVANQDAAVGGPGLPYVLGCLTPCEDVRLSVGGGC